MPLEACLQSSPGFGVSADMLWTPIPGGTRLWQGALPEGGCASVTYPRAHLPSNLPVALSVEAHPKSEQGGDGSRDRQTSYMPHTCACFLGAPLGARPAASTTLPPGPARWGGVLGPPPRCPPRALWPRGACVR